MKVIILNGLGKMFAINCMDSLLQTSNIDKKNVLIINELDTREQTLNYALNVIGTDNDILFVGDDIVFVSDWYTSLMDNLHKADILGMSMLYPKTSIVQDRGYRLVCIDGDITLQAIDRGKDVSLVSPDQFNYCDSVCGCFLFVKKWVFQKVAKFSGDGKNRWGELIFTLEARKAGATVGVVNHYLYHHGHGTKNNQNKLYSSTSYRVELPIWQKIVNKYVDKTKILVKRTTEIEPTIRNIIENHKLKILIYGIGTVAEKLLVKSSSEFSNINICTGLLEEVGLKLNNITVQHVDDITLGDYDRILITPLLRSPEIFKQYIKNRLPSNYKGTISGIVVKENNNKLIYSAMDISLYAHCSKIETQKSCHD